MTTGRAVRPWIGPGLLGVIVALAACGGADPYCGDGETDPGEQCDDGNDDQTDFCRNCRVYLPPRTTVKWLFNAAAAEGFVQDSCIDLRVSRVRVELAGPTSLTLEDPCPNRQVVFQDLPRGAYTATMTPLDSAGVSLVHAPVTAQVTAEAVDTESTIVVPFESWSGSYTGSFHFKIRWGGATCDAAMPPVAQQRVTLTVNGSVVTQMTTTGHRLDGTPGTCVPANGPDQTALLVPFGPATILIVGHDEGGDEAFRDSFETFVGAGTSNPTLQYDVAAIPDAGL